jgi:hypothetical protein
MQQRTVLLLVRTITLFSTWSLQTPKAGTIMGSGTLDAAIALSSTWSLQIPKASIMGSKNAPLVSILHTILVRTINLSATWSLQTPKAGTMDSGTSDAAHRTACCTAPQTADLSWTATPKGALPGC